MVNRINNAFKYSVLAVILIHASVEKNALKFSNPTNSLPNIPVVDSVINKGHIKAAHRNVSKYNQKDDDRKA